MNSGVISLKTVFRRGIIKQTGCPYLLRDYNKEHWHVWNMRVYFKTEYYTG